MFDLLKIWILTYAITRPTAWLAIVVLFSLLLMLMTIFVQFRNGWISFICFLILEITGGIVLFAMVDKQQNSDDLHLQQSEVTIIKDVTPQGVVLQQRFKQKTVALLGIQLPPETSPYFQSAKDRILNSRFDGKLRTQRSSAFSGLVLFDAKQMCINQTLLSEGLAYTSGVTPKQYLILQKHACDSKRGVWSLPIVSQPPTKLQSALLDYSISWLLLLESVSISTVFVLWLKKVN